MLALAARAAVPCVRPSARVLPRTGPGDPHYDINDYDAQRDADDWCKLAHHEPHKARRQLAKAVALVRGENNPNATTSIPSKAQRRGCIFNCSGTG